MVTNLDLASFSYAELVALVQELQRCLTERERQIEQLEGQLAKQPAMRQLSPSAVEEPTSGSQEDLLAQLEKLYPEG